MSDQSDYQAAIERAAYREKWDRRFLQIAKQVSTWSKDQSTQVGVVLVNDLKQIVGTGYNGFPRGVADTDERYANRDLKYPMVVHAEVNAILTAGERGRGCTLYIYPSFMLPPLCATCAGIAIQAGIVGVVCYVPDATNPRAARWATSIGIAKTMWDEAGKFIRAYTE